jgi:hypothetical protein
MTGSTPPVGEARASVVRLRAVLERLVRSVPFPETTPLAEAARALGAPEGAARRPAPDVLLGVATRIHEAVQASGVRSVAPRDLRDAPWVMWEGPKPVVELPGVLDATVAKAERSRSGLKRLIEAWLRAFRKDRPGIAQAGRAIAQLVARTDDHRFHRWREAHSRFSLFDASTGPGKLAVAVLSGSEAPGSALAAAGLDDPLRASGGYMKAVHDEALRIGSRALRDARTVAHVAGRLPGLLENEDRTLRFPGDRGPVARELLRPWLDGGAEPGAAAREFVMGFLLRHVGDPTLKAASWREVGDREAALVRRWRTKVSLGTFFELISDQGVDKQWEYRQAFWSAYLERSHIDEAWLALGPEVALTAKSMKELGGQYGRLAGGDNNRNSVILMRIGRLILCEWSYVGSLRAWLADHEGAPQLGKSVYHRYEFRTPCLEFEAAGYVDPAKLHASGGLWHRKPAAGWWQERAARLIRAYTGIHLNRQDWMPKG